jgi:hypothetical protein
MVPHAYPANSCSVERGNREAFNSKTKALEE